MRNNQSTVRPGSATERPVSWMVIERGSHDVLAVAAFFDAGC